MTHTALATPLHRLQATSTPPDDLFATQLQREEQQRRRSQEQEQANQRKLKEVGKESSLRYGRALYQTQHEKLKKALDILFEQAVSRAGMARAYGSIYPVFDVFDSTDQVAAVALIAALDMLTRKMVRPTFCARIGAAIERESRLIHLRQRAPLVQRHLFKSAMSRRTVASRHVMNALNCHQPAWNEKTRMLVGAFLMDVIVNATGLFKLVRSKRGKYWTEQVVATDDALEFVRQARSREVSTAYGPMLVPPRPWRDVWSGGTLTNTDPLIRVNRQLSEKVAETVKRLYEPAAMGEVLRAVNYMQTICLYVDGEMVETARTAWDNGIEGLFPCRRVPPEVPERLSEDPDPEALRVRNRLAAAAMRDQEDNRQTRIRIERAIQAGEEMAGKELYQAVTVDHRGRYYAVNRTCTHQGRDPEKAVLNFRPEPVGEDGIDWIRKAAAGHYGLSRETWEARLHWGKQHHELLLAAAADPLGRLELWRSAKDPWQFLQLCKGYKEAVETGSTGVPIRLDQTTSGLGILSSLLRLEDTARLCNIHGKTPRDLYSVVAESVTKQLLTNLELGDAKERALAELWLEIGVSRSLIKGPVLAAPYGGSYMSTSDTVFQFLHEHYGYVPLEEYTYKLSTPSKYLAGIMWREMKPVISDAMEIQTWLRRSVRAAMAAEKPLEWTTPSGLPMEAAERMTRTVFVPTLLFGRMSSLNMEIPIEHKYNHKAAAKTITANYIHSFDAAMVTLVCGNAAERDIQIVCNHDCFATTPARASELHNLLLTGFAGLYRTDWLAVHHEEMQSRAGISLPEPPERGSMGVGLIGTNPYLFS